MPLRFLVLCVWMSIPLCAAFRVQQIRQIPAKPGQTIARTTVDSGGNLVAVGTYLEPEISSGPAGDGFVEKVDPAGRVLFVRLLPGAQNADLRMALDAQDNIYVTGHTLKADAFPFTNLSTTPGAIFVAKFRAQDGTLAYATSLAGVVPTAITVTGNNEALLAVAEFRGQMPTTPGAYASTFGSGLSTLMYLLRLSAGGDQVLLAASYGGSFTNCYGGSGCVTSSASTGAAQILLDRQGNIWVAGSTNTTNLPLTSNALKKTCGCSQFSGDGFLAEFSADGSRLLYATYIGTSTSGVLADDGNDIIRSAAMDGAGHIWMAGSTNGSDLPVTTNAAQPKWGGGTDGFLFEYDPANNLAAYVSYLGGSGDDSITNIALTPAGSMVLAGHGTAPPLPVSGFARGGDYVATLNPPGMTTLVSGSTGAGLVVTPDGALVVAGASSVATYVQTSGDAAPSLYAVTSNAGHTAAGQVTYGELITLYGANLGPAQPAVADLSSGQAPQQLAAVRVLVNGIPAPILYAQSDQVNAIMSFDTSRQSAVTLVVNNSGADSTPALLGVVDAAPEAYAVLNQDQTLNGPANPAAPGSIVSVFATGFGLLVPKPADGSVLAGTLPSLYWPVEVLYNGRPLEVTYAGPAPFLVAGVVQVNFRLPVSSAETLFQLDVAGWTSSNFAVVIP